MPSNIHSNTIISVEVVNRGGFIPTHSEYASEPRYSILNLVSVADERTIGLRTDGLTKEPSSKSTTIPTLGKDTVTADAQEMLKKYTVLRERLDDAFGYLGSLFPEQFKANIGRFVDPYDGSKLLTVELKSSVGYRETSDRIDQFFKEYWFQFMDSLPVSVIFEAGE